MLSQLSINNIAVIERASIDFSAGLTVMTGETGAGKSIIVDAINAVLGERTSKELIRTGSGSASVFALFTDIDENTLDFIRKEGYQPEEDGSVLIQREIRVEGKSMCKLNGAPIILSALKQIGSRLISIHGQHESYDLLSPEVHINYIDSFSENDSALNEYKEGNKTSILITGVTWGLSILFGLRAYQFGTVTTVAPLSATVVTSKVFALLPTTLEPFNHL